MESDPKPPSISRNDFVRNLTESGLLPEDEVEQALQVFFAQQPRGDAASLAQMFVDAKKLTPFQVDAVWRRRFGVLRIGGYEILEMLGKGGMGTVYKARHLRMKRVAAIKVLSPEVAGQATFVQRFQREVETIAQLSHPNIVMAYDAGESEIGHFLVMEFVNGCDLAHEVQQLGPLRIADAVDCIAQAAGGLEYAHAQGLVHRDVKPANLLRDTAGVVKVADLGLARINPLDGPANSGSLTQAGGIVGTMDYLPPEQALDSTHIDRRADIYSLGCTMFYLMTGRPPYSANSMMALLLQHRDAPIPTISAFRPSVPEQVETIFRRMVAKKPEERYLSMSEVIGAVEDARDALSMLVHQVTVRKPMGAGSLFDTTVAADSAEFPQKPSAPPIPESPSDTMPPIAAHLLDLSVVIVEPSRTQGGIIRKFLQQMGINKSSIAASGEQAHHMVKQDRADVVVSAMHLSDMTGVQLVQAMRADPSCAAVGFVLASSESDGGELSSLMGMPRTVLMHKPFDIRKLAHSIAEATGRDVSELLPAT